MRWRVLVFGVMLMATAVPSANHAVAASPIAIQELKERLKAQIEAGQLQWNPGLINANRALLGMPQARIVNGAPPDGNMDESNVAGYGQWPADQAVNPSVVASMRMKPHDHGFDGTWYWVSLSKWIEPDGGFGSSSCAGYNGYKDPLNSHQIGWYANLCGPGASLALTTNWNQKYNNYTGAYYNGSQHWLGYYFDLANKELQYTICPENNWPNYSAYWQNGNSWETCDARYVSTVNQEIGSSYYVTDWCAAPSGTNPNCSNPSFTDWQSDIFADIATVGHPLTAEVMTCAQGNTQCLPGWTYRADHFQTISQDDSADSLDKYVETGNAADISGCPSGAVPGAWTGQWWDWWKGQYRTFTSGGWFNLSNFTHFSRTRQLTW